MTMQELARDQGEIKQTLAKYGERLESLGERIDDMETEQKDQRRVLIVIERIASGLDTVKEKVDDIGRRVCHIEEKPAKRWESLVGQVIGLLIAAAAGFLLSKVGL